ncbi:MAG TPA: DUF1326 domain-containing protein [Terriglobia bacterium]|nr:DUF1326 domain-containing protein [Terriglobia bacterium]
MKKKPSLLGIRLLPVLVGLVAWSVVAAAEKPKATATGQHWEISGDLSEACTCNVPCSCNFGQGPSPHHFCWSLFSLAIQKGHYGSVSLDGLRLAGSHGKKSKVWYIDDRATPEQGEALKAIATHIDPSANHWERAHIVQEAGEKTNKLQIGDQGGFEADYITGMDGKTPVVVENNTSWNIPKSVKGKTKFLRYSDEFGNKFDMTGTNSNQGKFDWTDETKEYF